MKKWRWINFTSDVDLKQLFLEKNYIYIFPYQGHERDLQVTTKIRPDKAHVLTSLKQLSPGANKLTQSMEGLC